MTCQHLSDKGTPCGRPAVAAWTHPMTGTTWLCDRHDDHARMACANDPCLDEQWVREVPA